MDLLRSGIVHDEVLFVFHGDHKMLHACRPGAQHRLHYDALGRIVVRGYNQFLFRILQQGFERVGQGIQCNGNTINKNLAIACQRERYRCFSLEFFSLPLR